MHHEIVVVESSGGQRKVRVGWLESRERERKIIKEKVEEEIMRLNMVWTVDKIRGKGRASEQGYLFWEVAEREAGGDRSKVGVVTGAKVRAVECGHCTMYVPVRG